MQRPNVFYDYVAVVWPRILGVVRIRPANMDIPHALGRPMLRAELLSPIRFHGPKRARTDSVVTVQTQLRGLPYFDAYRIQQQKLANLNLRTRSGPRAPTGTAR